jgi:predicted dehydrogenase
MTRQRLNEKTVEGDRRPPDGSIGRRGLLKGALTAAVVGAAPFNILKAGPSPNSKLNIAVIGAGGRGGADAKMFLHEDNVIAFCDVDEAWFRRRNGRAKELRGIKLWKDYRVMYDRIGKQIDAIAVATPDHAHFAPSMFAIRRDKHVYCQKPLCRSVNEVRVLTEESRKHKVITQLGNQGHSTRGVANVRDWVQGGCIGDVREVHAFSWKNYCTLAEPAKGGAIPKTLDWDLWLNRAEKIPFSQSYINRNWIRYSHFSGVVGDMATHILDPAYYALDLGVPVSVMAEVAKPTRSGWTPRSVIITWEFAARGKMPPVTMKYYLGPDIPRPHFKHIEKGRKIPFLQPRSRLGGSILVGQHASIMAGEAGEGCRIFPEATMKATKKPPEVAYRGNTGNHWNNWTRAIKGKEKAMSQFDYAGPFAEIVSLGEIASMHPGRKLLWDSKNMRITNDEAANKSTFMRRLAPRDDMKWI